MATQQPQSKNLLRSAAGLSLLEKVLNGENPNPQEMAVAQKMAQEAVEQKQKDQGNKLSARQV